MNVGGIEFEKTDLIYQDGKVYYKAVAGLRERGLKCVRNIGQYKLYALHQDCALPYTWYCLVDTKTNDVYRSGEYHPDFCSLRNVRDKIVNDLESQNKKKVTFVYRNKIYSVREDKKICDEIGNVLSEEDIDNIEKKSGDYIQEHPLTNLADKVWRETFSK